MLNPQFILPISADLVVDLFAGGGGASTGIELAIGHHMTKTAQVRMCGNSVCPPLARALVAANYSEAHAMRAAA
jgi:site-specific DNA-cytosine methylase